MPKRYRYYNRNPDNLKLKDCVCRAISTAVGLQYEAVDNLLELTADIYNCDKLCVCCYHRLLEDVLCYNKIPCYFKQTVSQIASAHPKDRVIIRVDAHLTTSIYGSVLDIWDCSDELVDCYWIVT